MTQAEFLKEVTAFLISNNLCRAGLDDAAFKDTFFHDYEVEKDGFTPYLHSAFIEGYKKIFYKISMTHEQFLEVASTLLISKKMDTAGLADTNFTTTFFREYEVEIDGFTPYLQPIFISEYKKQLNENRQDSRQFTKRQFSNDSGYDSQENDEPSYNGYDFKDLENASSGDDYLHDIENLPHSELFNPSKPAIKSLSQT